jgi:hypothetical protein
MDNLFNDGDRVEISDAFFWAKGATGTVSLAPAEVTAISGPWDCGISRLETSALGTNRTYWVWFDEPQYDADGDGPYKGGSIWESALIKLAEKVSGPGAGGAK